jgi:hypothetical protein
MYDALKHSHSGLRWLVLILLVYAIYNAYSRYKAGAKYRGVDKMVNVMTMGMVHLQIVIGLILYFVSPIVEAGLSNFGSAMKDSTLRFSVMEHLVMMVAAAVLITIGYKRGRTAKEPKLMHRRIFVWYTVVLVLILAAIPWPFRFDVSGWF